MRDGTRGAYTGATITTIILLVANLFNKKDQSIMTTYQQRILGGLWGAIVGDALGVPVEFTSRDTRKRDPVIDMRGYGTHIQPPGTWSDDTSMLLCTVEALCEEEYHVEQLAALFLA